MFKTELIANNTSLDLTEELPVSLNFNIADIRKPENRNGSYSKTIKLLGTKTNNKFFEHLYSVNVASNSFNPNAKTRCYILQEGSVVFDGNLRLRSIEKTLQNNTEEISYEIEVYGDNNTLFAEIGDAKLEALDLSAYNHTYNRITQYNTWAATQGVGYCYPIIDYGYNAFLTNQFKVEWLRPAIYVKQYVDSIFSAAGKTYTSSFFNTAFFKSLIIPHNGDKFTMSGSSLANYEFYVGDDGTRAVSNISLTYKGLGIGWATNANLTSTTSLFDLKFNDETTSPFVDTGGLYDTSTGIFTIAQSGSYNVNAVIGFQVKFNHSSPFTSVVASSLNSVRYNIRIFKRANGFAAWTIFSTVNNVVSTASVTMGASYANLTINWNNSALVCVAGEQMKMVFDFTYTNTNQGVDYYNGVTLLNTGTASMDIRLRSNASLKMSLASADYLPNQTITINDAIPKDVKQKDFLTSLFKMFNLYVDIDKTCLLYTSPSPRDRG